MTLFYICIAFVLNRNYKSGSDQRLQLHGQISNLIHIFHHTFPDGIELHWHTMRAQHFHDLVLHLGVLRRSELTKCPRHGQLCHGQDGVSKDHIFSGGIQLQRWIEQRFWSLHKQPINRHNHQELQQVCKPSAVIVRKSLILHTSPSKVDAVKQIHCFIIWQQLSALSRIQRQNHVQC